MHADPNVKPLLPLEKSWGEKERGKIKTLV